MALLGTRAKPLCGLPFIGALLENFERPSAISLKTCVVPPPARRFGPHLCLLGTWLQARMLPVRLQQWQLFRTCIIITMHLCTWARRCHFCTVEIIQWGNPAHQAAAPPPELKPSSEQWQPMAYCACGSPCSAAQLSHFVASLGFLLVPRPSLQKIPKWYCALQDQANHESKQYLNVPAISQVKEKYRKLK